MDSLDKAVEMANLSNQFNNFNGASNEQMFDDFNKGAEIAKRAGNIALANRLEQAAKLTKQIPKINSSANIANFNLNFNRKTSNINSDLTIPVFGANLISSQYYEQFKEFNTGITYDIFLGTATTRDKILFRFTQGANIDDVEITCNEVSVVQLYRNLQRITLGLATVRIILATAAQAPAGYTPWYLRGQSLLGRKNEDTLEIGRMVDPKNFIPNYLDVGLNWSINPNECIFFAVKNSGVPATPTTLTWSITPNYAVETEI